MNPVKGLSRLPGGRSELWREARREMAKKPAEDLSALEAKLAALSPEERAELEGNLEKLKAILDVAMSKSFGMTPVQWGDYSKNLLKRLGVQTHVVDFEEFWVQMKAAARYVGIPGEEFWKMTPREICALLEHEANKRELLQRAANPERPAPEARPVPAVKRVRKVLKDDPLEAVRILVRQLKEEGVSHENICNRLGSQDRPAGAEWAHLTWPKAYKQFRESVDKWLSKHGKIDPIHT